MTEPSPHVPPGPSRNTDTPLTETAAADFIAADAFQTGPPSRVGAEVEWILVPLDGRSRPEPAEIHAGLQAGGAMPRHSRLSFEPGGALELSSPPQPTVGACFEVIEADRIRIEKALEHAGVRMAGIGLDPVRPPRRMVRNRRYEAMESLFDQDGRAGRWMMASTASVQVCLDVGTEAPGPEGYRERWRLANLLTPVLVAAFANSPFRLGRPTAWHSTRQHVWQAVDSTRSRPGPITDPRSSWARYALDARVMAIRMPGRWIVPRGLTFREWIRTGRPRRPTTEDLRFHLSTLFPPVRPRGRYIELRMIDAQPGRDWIVPVAVAATLLDDPDANQTALRALKTLWSRSIDVDDLYRRAAGAALHDEAIAEAALSCFTAARAALGERGDPRIAELVGGFAERYTARGRVPADDLLENRDAELPTG